MSSLAAYLLYTAFALGGVGVYFALPRTGRSTRVAGSIIGLAGIALLLVTLASNSAGQPYPFLFYLFGAIAIAAAGRVVTHPKPVYSALYFVLVVIATAFLIVLRQAEFLAVALIIIYAGAILVTYVFVLMLAQQTRPSSCDLRSREPLLGVLAGFVTMAAVAVQMEHLPERGLPPGEPPIRMVNQPVTQGPGEDVPEPAAAVEIGNTEAVGRMLLTQYVITLEVAGVLLLVAMIGAIAIARKRVPADEVAELEKPLGQIGREVPPF